jgi:CheY-like chemotaxis protein
MVHAGVAPLEAAGEWRPDVIICDLGMPGLDGYETCTPADRRRGPGSLLMPVPALRILGYFSHQSAEWPDGIVGI